VLVPLLGVNRHVKTGLLIALAAALTGCGTRAVRAPEARRSQGLVVGAGEASWDAVLPGPMLAQAAIAGGPESHRRNDGLSYRPYDAVTAMDDWPTRTRPDLSRWRRITLPRDANSVLYFEQGERRRSSGYDGHGGYGGSYGSPRYDRYGRGGQY